MPETQVRDCLFCKIATGTIPVATLYQDEQVLAFADIAPQAPTHFLVIPRVHMASLAHAARDSDDHAPLLGHLLYVAADLATKHGLSDPETGGFRTVINTGPHGGQTVDHLHVHVLGGRAMHWPPG